MEITIILKNLESALNEYNDKDLSDSLNNYIMENCKESIKTKNITLNISGIKSPKEKEYLTKVIHNYYNEKVIIFQRFDTLDDYFKAVLSIIGIIAILISEKFESLLNELFLIAGWVIIWEIVYDLFFKEIERQKKNKIYKSLANCKINFNTR